MAAEQELRFADVRVGDRLPTLSRGPLTTMHLMRFSAAIENWHRIHYDERFAVEHDGLPGLLVSGSWKHHFVGQMVRAWLAPHGWMTELGLQFRAPNVAGDTLTAWGRVTDVAESGGLGVVRCEIGIVDQAGRESSPGQATGVLPLDSAAPVPYPFPGLAAIG